MFLKNRGDMKNFKQKSLDNNQKDLGLKIPSITNYMVSVGKLITFKEDTPIMEVLDGLLKNRITGAPVLNDSGDVVGLIDDKDCLNILIGNAYYNHPMGKDKVSTYMSNVMKTIPISSDVLNAANIFMTTPYKRLLVMDHNNKLAGQISRRDILIAIKDMNVNTTW